MGGRRRPRGTQLVVDVANMDPRPAVLPPCYPIGKSQWLAFFDAPETSAFDYAARLERERRAGLSLTASAPRGGAATKARGGSTTWPCRDLRALPGGVLVPWNHASAEPVDLGAEPLTRPAGSTGATA